MGLSDLRRICRKHDVRRYLEYLCCKRYSASMIARAVHNHALFCLLCIQLGYGVQSSSELERSAALTFPDKTSVVSTGLKDSWNMSTACSLTFSENFHI